MRIAIIGASGMLGHHAAAAALAAGHELRITYRREAALAKLQDLRYEAVQADLDDRDSLTRALQGVDGVINAAAYYPTLPRRWQDDVADARRQMENFFAAAEAAKVGRILYVGGAIALPKRRDGLPADGSGRYQSPPLTSNGYVQVKWAMDEMSLQKAAEGLPVSIGIPSMTFGEYDWGPSTGQFVTGIASGKLPRYVQGRRNVVYAGDAGRGLVLALERGLPGKRYLLTGQNTDMDQLTATIARVSGMPAPRPAPLLVASSIGKLQNWRYRAFGGKLPTISETAIAVMSAGQHLDDSSGKLIGYTPSVGLDEMIERALKWFRAQKMC
ncbi:NAD-dependent epimerase/dehydratase family protein [Solimonas sp. K1W22B-7]|uniref:NAD-dependent epimerase/dehydratase family protein n=1 Tax=Solimonas sp. K1W22B-7 TaxID=2303331 RepID=UPI000E333997|nr:NAD-dependent epimerase/dehydratase family protein [Solimonas sp. K1W22B-7]AXQ27983.1 NAD-dependent epimerase/dehydratase family protein [Solimonas sp. K1W22B-7]